MTGQQQHGGTEPPAPLLAQELLVKNGNTAKAYLSVLLTSPAGVSVPSQNLCENVRCYYLHFTDPQKYLDIKLPVRSRRTQYLNTYLDLSDLLITCCQWDFDLPDV